MTITIYKLTDRKHKTHTNTLWVPGEWHEVPGGGERHGWGWLHAYEHSLLAAFFNPIHAAILDPILWLGEADGVIKHFNGTKIGSTRMRVMEQVPLPDLPTNVRIRTAIMCAKTVCHKKGWNAWADNWLSGKDRSAAAAEAAAEWAETAAGWAVQAAWAADALEYASAAAEWAAEAANVSDVELVSIIEQAIADEAEIAK